MRSCASQSQNPLEGGRGVSRRKDSPLRLNIMSQKNVFSPSALRNKGFFIENSDKSNIEIKKFITIEKYAVSLLSLHYEFLKYMIPVITYTSLYIREIKRAESLFFRFKIFLCTCFSLHCFTNFMTILTKQRILFNIF